jgi:hypothetical protein
MKQILISFLLCAVSSVFLFGQTDSIQSLVNGTVISSQTNENIPFAIIGIQADAENDISKYYTADSTGHFSITIDKQGDITLEFKAVGFLPDSLNVNIEAQNAITELGKIKLNPVDETLEEVTITEEKPLIRTESDKIIYNTEVDPDIDNSTALEILRKVPLVSVDGEDNIRLKGKTDFKIYMNGKESVFTKNNASEFLKSLPANTIKEIEVITSPGAKYDAEGIGGIINIVTEQKKISGYTLNINANVTSLKRMYSGISLTAGFGKFVISANVVGAYRGINRNTGYSSNENFNSELMHLNETESYSDYHGNHVWGTASMSYEFDTLNLISGEFQLWQGNYNADNYSSTEIFTAEDILFQAFNRENTTSYLYGGRSGNIDYQHTSKRNKNELFTLSYKFNNYPGGRETEQMIDSILNSNNEHITLNNENISNESTFQIDYVYPIIEPIGIEIGSKYIMRRNSSLSEGMYYDYISGQFIPNEDEFIDFNHNQDIIAGYLSLNGKIKKFSYKAGIRVENSETKGFFNSESDTDFKNTSFEYVPSGSLSYQFGKMHSVQAGYSKRIQRPGIWYLNPYVDDTNPKYIKYGNPNLSTEHVHSFYWNMYLFTKIGSINFGTYYDLTGNGIGSVYDLKDEDIIHESYENIIQETTYGLNFNANINLFKKLSLNANITTDYNVMENQNDASMNNTSWGSYSYMSARYSFKKSFVLSAFGGLYSFPGGLQRSSYLFYYQGISLKKSFFNDKLSLTLSGRDLFWKDKEIKYEIKDDNFFQEGNTVRPGRNIRFGISYKIGEMKTYVKRARRGIQNTDLKSGGDNDNTGE